MMFVVSVSIAGRCTGADLVALVLQMMFACNACVGGDTKCKGVLLQDDRGGDSEVGMIVV